MYEQIFHVLDLYNYLFDWLELPDILILRQLNKFHHNFIFDDIIKEIVEVNKSEFKLCIQCCNAYLDRNIFFKACASGKISLVNFLINKFKWNFADGLYGAACNSKVKIIEMLYGEVSNEIIIFSLYSAAALADVPTVKLLNSLAENIPKINSEGNLRRKLFNIACINDNLPVAKFIYNKSHYINLSDVIFNTAYHKKYSILKWLLTLDLYPNDYTRIFELAANPFNIELLELLYEYHESNPKKYWMDFNDIFKMACHKNNTDLIQWIHSKPIEITTSIYDLLENACKNNQTEIAAELYKNYRIDNKLINKYIIPNLIKNNKKELLQIFNST